MKRKLAWVCLLVSPLVLGGAALSFSDRDPISKANCVKINKGMTIKEVEAILGRAKDDEEYLWGAPLLTWKGSRGNICVAFTAPDHIVDDAWFEKPEPQTIFEKLRSWLGF
jgi:hypothetical protein